MILGVAPPSSQTLFLFRLASWDNLATQSDFKNRLKAEFQLLDPLIFLLLLTNILANHFFISSHD